MFARWGPRRIDTTDTSYASGEDVIIVEVANQNNICSGNVRSARSVHGWQMNLIYLTFIVLIDVILLWLMPIAPIGLSEDASNSVYLGCYLDRIEFILNLSVKQDSSTDRNEKLIYLQNVLSSFSIKWRESI